LLQHCKYPLLQSDIPPPVQELEPQRDFITSGMFIGTKFWAFPKLLKQLGRVGRSRVSGTRPKSLGAPLETDKLRIFRSCSLPLRTVPSLPLRLGLDSSREHFRHRQTPIRCLLITAGPSHGRSSSGHSVNFLFALGILPNLFVFSNC